MGRTDVVPGKLYQYSVKPEIGKVANITLTMGRGDWMG